MAYWILLGLLVALLAWAAWRQRRYGGNTDYDRDGFHSDAWRHSDYHPWGLGNRAGDEKDSN